MYFSIKAFWYLSSTRIISMRKLMITTVSSTVVTNDNVARTATTLGACVEMSLKTDATKSAHAQPCISPRAFARKSCSLALRSRSLTDTDGGEGLPNEVIHKKDTMVAVTASEKLVPGPALPAPARSLLNSACKTSYQPQPTRKPIVFSSSASIVSSRVRKEILAVILRSATSQGACCSMACRAKSSSFSAMSSASSTGCGTSAVTRYERYLGSRMAGTFLGIVTLGSFAPGNLICCGSFGGDGSFRFCGSFGIGNDGPVCPAPFLPLGGAGEAASAFCCSLAAACLASS
mmetsp:Transcript_50873/g.149984  ORF Transcript_50873/g.149984 Transcript_50873/m.149984 type:complete len:290 (+) Transcript_50873:264-1133(+)